MNRRSFLGASALALGASIFFKRVTVFAQGKLADLKLKDADMAEPGKVATVAQYCVDPDGGAKTCPERKKPERKGQYCDNCQFYTAKGLHKGKEVGNCALIPGKYVEAKAWCQTWVKKAGT